MMQRQYGHVAVLSGQRCTMSSAQSAAVVQQQAAAAVAARRGACHGAWQHASPFADVRHATAASAAPRCTRVALTTQRVLAGLDHGGGRGVQAHAARAALAADAAARAAAAGLLLARVGARVPQVVRWRG
jgi:hypothetical protein